MVNFSPLEAPVQNAKLLPVMHPGRPVGRDDLLKDVYLHLKNDRSVFLYGQSGVGKTALAAALANAYTGQPGGVLWLNVDNSTMAELVIRIGRAYQIGEITSSEVPAGMVGAAAATIAEHRPFIVLDGLLDEQVANEFIVKIAGNLPVLLVQDEEAPAEGAWQAVEVGALVDTDAVVLFKQKAAIKDNSSDIDIYGIVKLLQYRPLPIVIAARAMVASKKSASEYFKILQQLVQSGKTPEEAAITASFMALTGALQGIVLMMGAIFGGQTSAQLLSMISNVPEQSAAQALDVLTQLHLVERYQRYEIPYYHLHSVVYEFAHDRLRQSEKLDALREKVRDAVLAYAERYSADTLDAHQRLAVEMDTFLRLAAWASEQGNREAANKLVVALTQAGDFVSTGGYLYELLQLRQYGAGDTQAFPAYDDVQPALPEDDDFFIDDENYEDVEAEDEADSAQLAQAEQLLRTIEAGMAGSETIDITPLRTALADARQHGDTERQIRLLKAIGKVQIDQHRENEAISTYTEVLQLYETAEDAANVLATLDMLSALLAKTDNSQAAILHASRGIKLAEEQSDEETKMHLLTTLGDARQQLGETEAAVQALTQALEIARKREDEQNEALILYKLGYAQLDDGDPQAAIDTWEQALKLFRSQSKRNYEGRTLGGLGTAYGELERWSEAIRFHTSALHIAREVGDREEEALQLNNLALANMKAENLPDALLRYRQALHLAYEQGNRDDIVSTIVDLVRLMLRSKRLLSICNLLVDDALHYDPNDHDVIDLKQQVQTALTQALANGVQLAEVKGTARDYARLAYEMLEE